MKIKIHQIGNYMVKNYLLETPAGMIAIDTGYPGGFARFKTRFEKKWPLSDLKYIFVTHHHDDHVGFLNELIAATKASVILQPRTIEYIATGRNNEPPSGGYSSGLASLFGRMKKDFSFPPVKVPADRMIVITSEKEQIFEDLGWPIKILFLPGHTDDSMGLFLTDSHILLCGDAAMNAMISVARHTIWIDHAPAYRRSWDKILSYRPNMIYPAHGAPFQAKDLRKYKNFLAGKKLIKLI